MPKVTCQHIDEDLNFIWRMGLELQSFNSLWKCQRQRMAALWKCFKRSYNLTQHSGQTDYTEGQHVPAFAEALPMPTDCTSFA